MSGSTTISSSGLFYSTYINPVKLMSGLFATNKSKVDITGWNQEGEWIG
jgi:hypothetical protein